MDLCNTLDELDELRANDKVLYNCIDVPYCQRMLYIFISKEVYNSIDIKYGFLIFTVEGFTSSFMLLCKQAVDRHNSELLSRVKTVIILITVYH